MTKFLKIARNPPYDPRPKTGHQDLKGYDRLWSRHWDSDEFTVAVILHCKRWIVEVLRICTLALSSCLLDELLWTRFKSLISLVLILQFTFLSNILLPFSHLVLCLIHPSFSFCLIRKRKYSSAMF